MAVKEGSFVALTMCFYCNEGSGILLHKRFGDLSAYDHKVCDMNPCTKCEELMKQGIMIISVRDGQYDVMEADRLKHEREHGRRTSYRESSYGYAGRSEDRVPPFIPNPYRTGVVMVMKDEAFQRIFCDAGNEGLIANIMRHRWSFMEDSVLELTGLFDQVDKPDEVPFRVECRKKGLDPREEAVRIAKEGRKASGKKEAKPEVQGSTPTGEDHSGGLPGDDEDGGEGER